MSGVLTVILWIIAICAGLLALAALRTRHLTRTAEATVPPAGRRVDVPGGQIHLVEQGPADGTPVVMIHGLSGQLQHMTYALSERLATTHRVVAVDRPGCGYSGTEPAGIAEQARRIGAALDALDLREAVVVGHSLGGAVALALALDRPDLVRALALICPATQAQTDVPEIFKGLEIRTPALRRLLGHTIAVPIAKLTAARVISLAFKPEPPVPDFLTRGGANLGLRPQGFITASSDLAAYEREIDAQVARYAGELRCPGAVLYGADDPILSPELHGRSLQTLGFDYQELPGLGHMIPFTAPDACAEFIRGVAALPAPEMHRTG